MRRLVCHFDEVDTDELTHSLTLYADTYILVFPILCFLRVSSAAAL